MTFALAFAAVSRGGAYPKPPVVGRPEGFQAGCPETSRKPKARFSGACLQAGELVASNSGSQMCFDTRKTNLKKQRAL